LAKEGPGKNSLNLTSLFHAAEHLLEAGPVEAHHDFAACCYHRYAAGSRDLHHLVQRGAILGYIILREFVPLLRKKLFRRLAVGSGGR
jgi:hypothetical protein